MCEGGQRTWYMSIFPNAEMALSVAISFGSVRESGLLMTVISTYGTQIQEYCEVSYQ